MNEMENMKAAEPWKDRIFIDDGVYHLCLRFPWQKQHIEIALPGVKTLAEALQVYFVFEKFSPV